MADDIPQDQTQTTTETTNPTIPPADQPSVEAPPTQSTPEQQPTIPVVPETPNIPNPPNSPNPEPVIPVTPEPQPEQTPPVPTPSILEIPALHYPFSGNFPVTFAFDQQSDNEEIKKKFQEWGITGHNGLDFGLTAGNEVFACDSGKVIQSGNNGDFGTSITIQHSWGQSIYAHLQETKVNEGEEIGANKVIGLSGSSGAAFGEHLHFAIKPNNPDLNNGYLGFIDPAPYLSLTSQKEETPPVQAPPTEEQKTSEETKPPETTSPSQEQPKPEETQQPSAEEVPPPIKLEPEKPADQPQVPQTSEEEIKKQVDEKLKIELDARRLKANETRSQKKEDHLNKIFELVRDKKVITNEDVRDFLHVSQSTATNYLSEMANRGMLKKEGERGGAKYSI